MPVPKGFKHSEETKRKISKAGMGKRPSELSLRKLAERNKGNRYGLGKTMSHENKAKLVARNISRRVSDETRAKMRALKRPWMMGARHWNWKGGSLSDVIRIRATAEFRLWRKKIFERDNFTCQLCGHRGGDLQVDHVRPVAFFPELILQMRNGRTLCVSCHKMTLTFGQRVHRHTRVSLEDLYRSVEEDLDSMNEEGWSVVNDLIKSIEE